MNAKTRPKTQISSRKSWGPISAVLVTALAFFGSQMLAGTAIIILGILAGYNVDEIANVVSSSTFWQFFYILISGVIALMILYVFMRLRGIKLSDIALSRLPKLSDAGWSLLAFGIYLPVLIAVMALTNVFIPVVDMDQEQQIGFEQAAGLALALAFIGLVIVPSFVEEIMIRGFLYGGLKNKLPQITAAISASFIFAAAHLQLAGDAPPLWVAAIDTFILSLFLIWLREKTGSLWAPIGTHFLKNSLAFSGLFILNW